VQAVPIHGMRIGRTKAAGPPPSPKATLEIDTCKQGTRQWRRVLCCDYYASCLFVFFESSW